MKKIWAIFFKISLKNRKKYLLRENYKKKKNKQVMGQSQVFQFICLALFSLFVQTCQELHHF